jgi:hypothetical protein
MYFQRKTNKKTVMRKHPSDFAGRRGQIHGVAPRPEDRRIQGLSAGPLWPPEIAIELASIIV